MKTDREISELWQMAHLKFHFGEKLAVNAMLSQKAKMGYGGAPAQAVVPINDSPGESRKEPDSLRMRDLATDIA